MFVDTYMDICMCITYVFIRTCMYVCMYMCMYVYIFLDCGQACSSAKWIRSASRSGAWNPVLGLYHSEFPFVADRLGNILSSM